jgi:hypothetical protein
MYAGDMDAEYVQRLSKDCNRLNAACRLMGDSVPLPLCITSLDSLHSYLVYTFRLFTFGSLS